MPKRESLRQAVPEPVKKILRPIRNRLVGKHSAELSFWKGRLKREKGRFVNSHYERIMLAMAEESDQRFIAEKVVADFGCGPRGSLAWAQSASMRIGIDVLSDRYADEFRENLLSHDMVYLKSTEKVIPLPTGFVDVMFSLNALDHVDDFATMCSEIVRVLRPGGAFIGSFNLEEPITACEPQSLSERTIQENLLDSLAVKSYRISTAGPDGDRYAPFFEGNLRYEPGQMGFLWVRAHKNGS
ncbi:class I SAM-dependent methyltransferase [Gemmatimonadota bacterium]